MSGKVPEIIIEDDRGFCAEGICYHDFLVSDIYLLVKEARTYIKRIYLNMMGDADYVKECGEDATKFRDILTSPKTAKILRAAEKTKDPYEAARLIRSSKIELALTFFEPYFLSAMRGLQDPNHPVCVVANELITSGLIARHIDVANPDHQQIAQAIGAHHDHFIGFGYYDDEHIPDYQAYKHYFIVHEDDNIESHFVSFTVGEAMHYERTEAMEQRVSFPPNHDGLDIYSVDAMYDSSVERIIALAEIVQPVRQAPKPRPLYPNNFDGFDKHHVTEASPKPAMVFPAHFDGFDKQATSSKSYYKPKDDTIETKSTRPRKPREHTDKVVQALATRQHFAPVNLPVAQLVMLDRCMRGTIRHLRNLDEIRGEASILLAINHGTMPCKRPAFVATELGAITLARALPPGFTLYNSQTHARIMPPH